MTINTTKTLERTSTVLGQRCEETAANIKRLMAEAGCAGAKLMKVTIPAQRECRDDVVFVGLNGAKFYFLRGVEVQMPEPVYCILRDAGVLA